MFVSHRTDHFNKVLSALPEDVQRQARLAYRQFKENPYQPSLDFKPVLTAGSNAYSAKVGAHYRVLGYRTAADVIIWDWIGSHETYNRVVKQRR